MTDTVKQEILEPCKIEAYNPFRGTVMQLIEENKTIAFDYETAKGEKEARSYIYKLRQSKTAIENKRVEVKAEYLETSKLIDTEAKGLKSAIDEMIDIHMKPIEEKAARQAARAAEVEEKFNSIEAAQNYSGKTSLEIAAIIADLKKMEVSPTVFDDRVAEAILRRDNAIEVLTLAHTQERQREDDKLELERLRIKAEQDAKREAEEKAAREEKERVEAAAEKAREDERVRSAEKVEAAEQAADIAEQARVDAVEQARKDKEEAEARAQQKIDEAKAEAERKEQAAEEKRQADAAAEKARLEDIEHRRSMNREALECFTSSGIEPDIAEKVVKLIASNLIKHVTIKY